MIEQIICFGLACTIGFKVKCSNCQEFGNIKVRCTWLVADQSEDDCGGGVVGSDMRTKENRE